jgi:ergothioneine biosynthesis protein EgtB
MKGAPLLNSSGDLPRRSSQGELLSHFLGVRALTESLCKPLKIEDYGIQSMEDVSPPKWHLAHTTWFFETFILIPHLNAYRPFHPQFQSLFNSYYKALGKHHPRPERGLLSRPTVEEVYHYRQTVNQAMEGLLRDSEPLPPEVKEATLLGIHHEQQHQELILMDIRHLLFSNPLKPAYQTISGTLEKMKAPPLKWISFEGGLKEIGFGGEGFSFDNEGPRHRVFLEDYRVASRLITNGEYLEFIESGAYQDPKLWLSDAWDRIQAQDQRAPLYWKKEEGRCEIFGFQGEKPLNPEEPVSHLSFYEADAFARWVGKRLPTEAEWECAAEGLEIEGNFLESGYLQPRVCPLPKKENSPSQFFGDVWEWTQSSYSPYPRFKPALGYFAEYNGKFMCNQFVLRGGCCWTPLSHIRRTYRNFYPPHTQWQCSGIRLAEDL